MGLVEEEISLAGSILRKSHRHSGQRVATEKTMWPKATHFAFMQVLIARLPISMEAPHHWENASTCSLVLACFFSDTTD